MSKLEVVALIVASLAAFSSLVNAGVVLFQAWLDSRRLTISVEPDPWARARPDLAGDCILVLNILNRGRTPNSVVQIRCRADSKDQQFELDPRHFLRQTIAPFSVAKAALKFEVDHLPPDSRSIEVTVVPVRGKARTFTIPKSELLPEF